MALWCTNCHWIWKCYSFFCFPSSLCDLQCFSGFLHLPFHLHVQQRSQRFIWIELFSCGRYKSKPLHSSQAKYATGNAIFEKIKTTSSGLTNSNLVSPISNKSGYSSNIDDLSKEERYTDIPLTSAADQEMEKPSVVSFKDDPEIHEANVGIDQKDDLESSEVKEKEQVLETSETSEELASPNTCEVKNDDLQTSS